MASNRSNPSALDAAHRLAGAGRYAEAHAAFVRLLARSPGDPELATAMCFVCARLGQADQALYYATVALKASPDDGNVLSNYGNALMAAGQPDRAADALLANSETVRGHAPACTVLSYALVRSNRYDEAERILNEAVAAHPESSALGANLASVLLGTGRAREGMALYRALRDRDGRNLVIRSGLAASMLYVRGVTPEELAREHASCGEAVAAMAGKPRNAWGVTPEPERALRVGVLSPDLRMHAVAFFIEAWFKHHDRERVRITAYSTATTLDGNSKRLGSMVERFRDVHALSEPALAETIAADRIDVLVDLAGYTVGGRLMALHLKPAPVQATWIGYPHATGLASMDWRIVDEQTDPPARDGDRSLWPGERPRRLDPCFVCYTAPVEPALGPCAFDAAQEPATMGPVTFGNFGSMPKIDEAVLDMWARVLERVPASRMVLRNHALGSRGVRDRILGAFAARGVEAARLSLLAPARDAAELLPTYGEVDVTLDTFPYSATTTACESLWMGVPVVTLTGDTSASRVCGSLLKAVGLSELVASTEEQYVEKAATLAASAPTLRAWKSDGPEGLRARMLASPLGDAPAHAARVDELIRGMWRDWCRGRG